MNILFAIYLLLGAFICTNLILAIKDKKANKGFSSWTRGTISDIVVRDNKKIMVVNWTDNQNKTNHVYEQIIRNKKPIDFLIKKYVGKKIFLMFDNKVNPVAVMPYQNYNNRITFNSITLIVLIFFVIRSGFSISS